MSLQNDFVALAITVFGVEACADVLTELVTASEQYRPGLPEAERAARMRGLTERIRALERDEEREAMRLEDASPDVPVERRADVDVALVLDEWRREPSA